MEGEHGVAVSGRGGDQVGEGRQFGGRHRLRLGLVQEVQGVGGVAAGAP
ncbi:hypothetical protein OG542_01535 [Streptomyces violaceus]